MQNKKGRLFMLMAALFFSLISTISKSITKIPLTEKLFISSLIGFIVILINNIFKKREILGNKKLILLVRGILGMLGLILYHFSLTKMSLADATVLYKMTPIFVLIITTIFLKEKVKRNLVIGIILVILGTVLVIKPTLETDIIPAIACLTASIITAFAYITANYLKKRENVSTIVFYYVMCSALFMLPGILSRSWITPSKKELFLLILMGLLTILAQTCMNLSYKFSAINDVTIYLNTEILISFLIGAIIFKEGFDVLSIIGGAIIIFVVTVVLPSNNDRELLDENVFEKSKNI